MEKRFVIAQYIATGATAATVIGFLTSRIASPDAGLVIMVLGALAGVVSYLFAGLLKAIKMAFGIAKLGWIFVPFPLCIVTYIVMFMVGMFALCFVPIIPVRKAYKEHMN